MDRSRIAAVIAAAALICQTGAMAFAAEEPAGPEAGPLLADTAEPAEDTPEDTAEEAPAEDTAEEETSEEDEAEETVDTSSWVTSGEWAYSAVDSGIRIEACESQESSLTVPDTIDGLTVTEIGKTAFAGVRAVSITLPATIEYISGDGPFFRSEELQEIIVDSANENYTSADGVLFTKDKTRLVCYPRARVNTSYDIPEGVKELGPRAFICSSVSGVTFPASLEKIGKECFKDCLRLGSADISGTAVTELAQSAFAGCSGLKEVLFPDTLTSVGKECFFGAGLSDADIPDSVTSIGDRAFGYFSNGDPDTSFFMSGAIGSAAEKYVSDNLLEAETDEDGNSTGDPQPAFLFLTHEQAAQEKEYLSMDIITSGDLVYTIKDDGTAGLVMCKSTEEVIEIPKQIDGVTVTSIVQRCFMYSYATDITLPDTVTEIGTDAFYNCVYLQRLTIPGACQVIEGDYPFSTCISLTEINVTEGDGAFSSEDGVLFDKGKTKVIKCPNSKEGVFTAPATLREIGEAAFADCGLIEEADLSGVTTINNAAFYNCESLKKVTLSPDLTTVGVDAFFNCASLEGVRLYNKVESIGDYAFGYIEEKVEGQEELQTKINEKFKMYVDKGSEGWKYATDRGIEVITGTILMNGKNVSVAFLIACAAAAVAAVLAVIGIIIGKKTKQKKEEKRIMEIKANAAERIKAKRAKEKGGEK